MHRCAEIGNIDCAQILLEFDAHIDAVNVAGQTAFHVAGINRNLEFGMFLMRNKAKTSCVEGCTKCRLLI